MAGITLPNGQWVPNDHPLALAYLRQQSSQTSAAAQPVPARVEAAPLATSSPTPTPANDDVFKRKVSDLLAALENPTSMDDPSLRAQQRAFDLSEERGLADTQRLLAEQAYASGNISAGGTAVSMQQARERASANKANFIAGAMKDAEATRKAQLMQVLGIGSEREMFDVGQAAEESRFSRNLTENARQFDTGQANEESRFSRNLTENARQADATLAQRASETAAQMGFNYAQLSQQDRQFIDNLTWQKEEAAAQRADAAAARSASAGAASAALERQRERDLRADAEWDAYNTAEVIDATNKARIAALYAQFGLQAPTGVTV